jgi:CBS domain-containing protein
LHDFVLFPTESSLTERIMSLERFTRKQVVVAAPSASAADVAALMHAHHVGGVVIVRDSTPVGIVTDRDLALRVVGAGLSADVPISRVMSRDLVVARVGASLDEAFHTMQRAGVRRLPIITDGGTLVGLVALDDLLVLLAGELRSTVEVVLDNRGP